MRSLRPFLFFLVSFGLLSITFPTLAATSADLNKDGVVNVQDLGILLANWCSTCTTTQKTAADLNADGAVNVSDLGILLANWNKTIAPPPPPSPSPTPTPPPPSPTPPPPTTGNTRFIVGPWHAPISDLGASDRWSGSSRVGYAPNLASDLAALNTSKARVSLGILRTKMQNADKTLNIAGAKAELDTWKAAADVDKYFVDGTIIGINVMDDADWPPLWGGTAPTPAQVDSIAQYAKQLWPHARVSMRQYPGWGGSYVWKYMDIAIAQYDGPYRNGTPSSYIAKHVADAKAAKLGLMITLNVLDGGCGPTSDTVSSPKCLSGVPGTGIWGTFENSALVHRYQVSAAELLAYGKAFINEPYNCALSNWRYSTSYDCTGSKYTTAQCQGIVAFDSRSDVQSSWNQLVALGKNRSAGQCVKPQ